MSSGELVALLAGLELLTAVLLAWRGPASSPRGPLAVQGFALAGLVAVIGVVHGERALWPVAVLVALLKGVLLPGLVVGRPVLRAAGVAGPARRPSRIPVLLSAAGLVVVADLVARPLAAVVTGPTGRALPVGFALVLIGFMLLVTGTRARAQLVGFLVLDNGIATTAFLATGGVPLVVELGASLDVLLVVLVLRVLGARLDTAFGGTDLDQLRELHD
jgi:hydrogenase-4 component E